MDMITQLLNRFNDKDIDITLNIKIKSKKNLVHKRRSKIRLPTTPPPSPTNIEILEQSLESNEQETSQSICVENLIVIEPVNLIENTIEWHSMQLPELIPESIIIENQQPLIIETEEIYPLDDLTYDNPRTKANVVSAINQLNKHFGWEPKYLHYTKIEDQPNAIVEFILKNYVIKNTSVLRTKLLQISGAQQRCRKTETTRLATLANIAERTISIPAVVDTRVFPDWNTESLPALQKIVDDKNNKICAVIAKCFIQGYVFRLSVIFNTVYGPNLGRNGLNYLDTVAKVWHLGKVKSSKPFSFTVSDAFIASLNPVDGEYMIKDVLATRRVNPSLGLYSWNSYTNNELRHSYEAYNISPTTGRSEAEQALWHSILGHTRATAHEFYVAPPADKLVALNTDLNK
jgi:hypothetical protein